MRSTNIKHRRSGIFISEPEAVRFQDQLVPDDRLCCRLTEPDLQRDLPFFCNRIHFFIRTIRLVDASELQVALLFQLGQQRVNLAVLGLPKWLKLEHQIVARTGRAGDQPQESIRECVQVKAP